MYISKIRLVNVRCYKDETIELGDLHPSLLITGNNGTGKSAILRSIAMGLCDEASAGGLLRELPGDFIREGENNATIEIWFAEDNKKNWIIVTNLALYSELNFERVHQRYYIDEVKEENEEKNWQKFPWEQIFIAGYGAGLRTDGTEDYDQYFSGDAVYTLFKYSQTLQNPELAWRRLESVANNNEDKKNKINKEIKDILHDVLDLDDGSEVQLKPNGIFISKGEQGKGDVEIGSVGDGYRAITTLTLDLLSWQFLMQNKDSENEVDWEPLLLDDMKRIVIIDEIEKHLHPLLQRQIIKHLHDKFKNIQFIISTHSPLCVSGTADIEGHNGPSYKIYCAYEKEDMTSGVEEREIPQGLRYDQILVDYFKLSTALNIKLENKIIRLRELFMKDKLEPEEVEELKELDSVLKEYSPLLSEGVAERRAEKNILDITEKLKAQLVKDGLLDD